MAYDSRLRDPALDRLFAGVLQLRSIDECYQFFEDLCTVGELRALAQRFQVAEMLRRGATYEEIRSRTGMSSATISRIKRFLHYGADGYRLVLERLEREVAMAEETASDARRSRAAVSRPDARPDRPTAGRGRGPRHSLAEDR